MSGLALAAAAEPECEAGLPWDWGQDPDLWLYRDRTVAMLLRFFRLSMETGRIPSVLGREFFRTHVTSHTLASFEDVVIFVHDVERCLERLDPLSRKLIARVVFQGYSQEEAARLEGLCRKTVTRRYRDAIDQFSEILLAVGILKRIERLPEEEEERCQDPKIEETLVTM
jgi:DNA-directed RNA polymerase specialized sigma24 family protein